MTREELRDYVDEQRTLNNIPYHVYSTLIDGIDTLEQQPCQDCISRKAVLDKIKEVCFSREQEWVDFRVSQGSNGQRNLIIKFIEDLPSVQSKTNVLDKLRAEIDKAQEPFMADKDYDEGVRFGLMLAYQIINKYKGEN